MIWRGAVLTNRAAPLPDLSAALSYQGDVVNPEIEDILRNTLISVAKEQLGWDAATISTKQIKRPIVDIFSSIAKENFSKFQLAKAFIRWSRDHCLDDLTTNEIAQAEKLIEKINKALS